MLGLADVDSVDSKGLWKAYKAWPAASRRALAEPLSLPRFNDPKLIVLAGMGGSGAACDIVHDWLSANGKTPCAVVKDFHLPRFVDKHCLVFAISLSGNTREILSVLGEAVARKCSVVAFSSDGELEKECKKTGVPFNRVERLLVPRASLPGMVLLPLRILQDMALAKTSTDIEDAVRSLRKTFSDISPDVDFQHNPAKRLARFLWKSSPVVYSSLGHLSAANHFRASMNENAKIPVGVGSFPEIFHNEIETWYHPRKRAVVLLRHGLEDKEVARRLARARSLMAKRGIRVFEVKQEGRLLASLLDWCLFLDMVSIYVAVLNGRSPSETHLIDMIRSV